MLKLYNSLTKKTENFVPIHDNKVTLYVCGITPYDTTHLGHGFVYIYFDTLVRYLRFKGFKVIYTQNVTDINDRDNDILKKAREQNIAWDKLANYWTKRFLSDMKNLNWQTPNYYLKASENIPQMIELIQRLIKNGFAYEKNGSVYLDISKKKDYGKLSGYTKKKMLAVSKDFEEDIDNPDKKHRLDITLWRNASENQPHIPSFGSPFGRGRPGWHIECSSMSISTLGEQIDIHGGGQDLIFPHHEAEIAQSEAATRKSPFAKYWIHAGTVYYKGEKMSKSLGNLIMVSDLLKKYSANGLRYYLLSHRRRNNWEFNQAELEKSEKDMAKITKVLKTLPNKPGNNSKDHIERFIAFMDNDLDTQSSLNLMLELADKKSFSLKSIFSVLGFSLQVV